MSGFQPVTVDGVRERFNRLWMPEPNSGCWLWTGAVNFGNGRQHSIRPRFHIGSGSSAEFSYRVAWWMQHGDIPEGLDVCHSCDVPICVNPAHLFLGTRIDNMQDCVTKGRTNKPRGEAASKAKLSVADVIAIRASGEPHKRLARAYGLDDKTIRQIRARASWRHVP